jgi:hypothetical protein
MHSVSLGVAKGMHTTLSDLFNKPADPHPKWLPTTADPDLAPHKTRNHFFSSGNSASPKQLPKAVLSPGAMQIAIH